MAVSRRSDRNPRETDTPTRDRSEAGRSTDAAAYQHVPRTVAAMPKRFADGESTGWHSHPRGQLLFAARGAMSVDAPGQRWTVPPLRGLWIPPQVPHSVTMRGRVEMRTLYLRPGRGLRLPARCTAFDVSPLLRELIARATEIPVLYDARGADGLVMRLLVAELARLPALPLALPVPADPTLARLCERLADAPAQGADLEALARGEGVSARTLSRRVVAATGLTPGQWRQRARALDALRRLAAGASVTRVALELGYDSPSAFGAMFRRVLGVSPSEAAGRRGGGA
jgi:AraC-like DNA-binding protein/quercetin dioxygenase-like cupin family protein